MRVLKNLKFFNLLTILVASVTLLSPSVNGANILGVFTSISPSHLIVHMSIAKALAEAGHNVTVVTALEPKVTHKSIKQIVIPVKEDQGKDITKSLDKWASTKKTVLNTMYNMITSMGSMIQVQVDTLKDERFTRLYEMPDTKFDLVILGFFLNEFQLGVAAKFKCPVIVAWPGSPGGLADKLVGNPAEIAYVPTVNLAIQAGKLMNFWQRMQNFITHYMFKLFFYFINYRSTNHYRDIFSKENDFPTYEDMIKNVSLVFCNSHFSEATARPNVPAVVEIGGIQIKDKPDPLPKDLADFLDTAKQDGGILFSLGTNLQASSIKPDTVQTIFKTLANLKQKVIWKWDDLNNLPGESPNILYKKWLPQDDILAHPNLKLFITHAGKGGLAEAQYHAVPMVALPVFADQPANAEKIALYGYGLNLDLFSLTETAFKDAILEVLQNPKYKASIKRFSDLYRDRPLTAKQNVVYWTEYVLRHHGAPHMQSPLVHLNFFQSTSLDVIGFLIFVVFLVFKVIKLFFKFILNKLRGKKEGNSKPNFIKQKLKKK